MPVQLLLPRRFYNEMVAQARAELPNECCGLLAGQMEDDDSSTPSTKIWRVVRRYGLVNKAASPVEYFAEERGLFDAFRDMRQQGLDLLAIYHSHPTTDPVPSRKDRERNCLVRDYLGEVVHLIVSLKAEEPVVRGWWLAENDYDEAKWSVC